MNRSHWMAGWAAVIMCAPAPAVWAGTAEPERRSVTTDRIVAIVNDDVITAREILSHSSRLLRQADAPAPSTPEEERQLQLATLQQLIEEKLIAQEAKRRGLTISSQDAAQRLEEVRGRFASEEEFQAMLADAELTQEQFRATLRDQLVIQRAIEYQIRPKIQISPAEIDRAAAGVEAAEIGDEIEVFHLLIRVTQERPEAEAKKLAEQLRQRLVGGADFERVAREHSDGPEADQGGRMGWVRPEQLLPELDGVLFALSPGQVSEPVRTRLGFHLLKAAQRRSVSARDATESRRKAEMAVYQKKFARELAAWLAELKERAYIHILGE